MWVGQCSHTNHIFNQYTTTDNYEAIAKRVIRRFFDDELTDGEIDEEVFNLNTESLTDSINEGWDSRLGFDKTVLRRLEMYQNVHVYAAFKWHAEFIEISAVANQLFDVDGNERTFSEFFKAVKPLHDQFNKTWLKAEYNYARASARAAAKWQRLANKGGVLIYKTIGDGAVRDSHRLLNNTRLPADHSFWDSYYPPNGWGCRCFVRHSSSTETKEPEGLPDDIPEMMRNNAGKTGAIFTDKHPIRQSLDETQLTDLIEYAEVRGGGYIRKQSIVGLKRFVSGKKYQFTDAFQEQQSFSITGKKLKKGLSGDRLQVLDKVAILLDLDTYLQTAEYIGSSPLRFDEGSKKRENKEELIEQYHYIKITKDNQEFLLDIEEYKNGKGYWFKTIKKLR